MKAYAALGYADDPDKVLANPREEPDEDSECGEVSDVLYFLATTC